MNETTRSNIRHIFLSSPDLRVHDGSVAARHVVLGPEAGDREWRNCSGFDSARVSGVEGGDDGGGDRVWEQAVIEEALGDEVASVLPEAIRLVKLRAWVPWYQREMLRYLARRDGISIDHVLSHL